jgi:hypothetical protein
MRLAANLAVLPPRTARVGGQTTCGHWMPVMRERPAQRMDAVLGGE